MSRELGPWQFVVNCLFAAEKPIGIDDEFWKYTSISYKKLLEKFPDIDIINDNYSLEKVILHQRIFLKLNEEETTIKLDKSTFKDKYLEEIVNYSLDDDIKKELPRIIKDAYNSYLKS